MTGWDVAEAFRQALPDIPVIYTSGLIQNQTKQVPEGTLLPQPYLPSDIVDLIEHNLHDDRSWHLADLQRAEVTVSWV